MTVDENQYEYRCIGCAPTGWRRTDWTTDREKAMADYEKARDSWSFVGFERRVPGDETTIQRKPRPVSGEWADLTEDMVHVKGEEVAQA